MDRGSAIARPGIKWANCQLTDRGSRVSNWVSLQPAHHRCGPKRTYSAYLAAALDEGDTKLLVAALGDIAPSARRLPSKVAREQSAQKPLRIPLSHRHQPNGYSQDLSRRRTTVAPASSNHCAGAIMRISTHALGCCAEIFHGELWRCDRTTNIRIDLDISVRTDLSQVSSLAILRLP
jgi:hypothetical protein